MSWCSTLEPVRRFQVARWTAAHPPAQDDAFPPGTRLPAGEARSAQAAFRLDGGPRGRGCCRTGLAVGFVPRRPSRPRQARHREDPDPPPCLCRGRTGACGPSQPTARPCGVPVAVFSATGRRRVITQPSVPDAIGPRTWRRPWLRGRLRFARRRSRAPMFPLDSRRRCARYSTLILAGDQGGLRLAARGRAGRRSSGGLASWPAVRRRARPKRKSLSPARGPPPRRWRDRGARHALSLSASFLQLVILGNVPN